MYKYVKNLIKENMNRNRTTFSAAAAALSAGLFLSTHSGIAGETNVEETSNFVFESIGDNYKLRMSGNELFFDGSVSTASINQAKEYVERLIENNPDQPINIIMDSTGGSVNAGYDFIDYIRGLDHPVNIQCDDVGSMAFMICISDAFEQNSGNAQSKGMFHFSYTNFMFGNADIELGAPADGMKIELDNYRTKLEAMDDQGIDRITTELDDARITLSREKAEAALNGIEDGQEFTILEFTSSESSDNEARRIRMSQADLQAHLNTMINSNSERVRFDLTGIEITFTRETVLERIATIEATHQRFAEEFAAASILTVEDVLTLDHDVFLSGAQMNALGLYDHYAGRVNRRQQPVALQEFCDKEPQVSVCTPAALDVN